MSKKKEKTSPQTAGTEEEILEEQAGPECEPQTDPECEPQTDTPAGEPEPEEAPAQEQLVPREQFLRLAAEYDNYRKRTAKEKESLWAGAKADTVQAFLPVYDNLERALKQDTADEAYKKGVEMTMNQLREVFAKLGITEIEAQGKPFDPNLHNAVMHIEDENLGENIVAQVFQAGFMLGEKVIRFAMVQVAN
ncbi:nucleotide exchange factor GrpE [Oscillospiraceae bacterium 50-16]